MGNPKIAIITGAARGIGAATVRRFADEGYVAIGLDVLDAEAALPEGAEHFLCDVADEGRVAAIVKDVLARHGRIDVLVNVAGKVLVKPITETDWAEFRSIADINIGGTFLMLKHVIPAMKAQNGGVIVNMGSVSGHVGQIDHALYGATKGAVMAMCRALAWELAPYNIRINSVSPGSVDTPMLRGDIAIESAATGLPFEEVKRMREGEQALGRWAEPEEIASAVWFLANDEAGFITGADLKVDCGWTAR
ncbi:MAG: SDR family oxidoreductase [Alphaproteobacteria bacterium]|nr:SDR family oxidoreductase [Alphaproteobacteria bacterium]